MLENWDHVNDSSLSDFNNPLLRCKTGASNADKQLNLFHISADKVSDKRELLGDLVALVVEGPDHISRGNQKMENESDKERWGLREDQDTRVDK